MLFVCFTSFNLNKFINISTLINILLTSNLNLTLSNTPNACTKFHLIQIVRWFNPWTQSDRHFFDALQKWFHACYGHYLECVRVSEWRRESNSNTVFHAVMLHRNVQLASKRIHDSSEAPISFFFLWFSLLLLLLLLLLFNYYILFRSKCIHLMKIESNAEADDSNHTSKSELSGNRSHFHQIYLVKGQNRSELLRHFQLFTIIFPPLIFIQVIWVSSKYS